MANDGEHGGDAVRYFISHAGSDTAWAEWIAGQLLQDGLEVELDAWDWATGENLTTLVSRALDNAGHMIALFSPAYFVAERWTTVEWTAMSDALRGSGRRLIPLVVHELDREAIPSVLRPLLRKTLYGKSEEDAREELMTAVHGPSRPTAPPAFPAPRTGGTGGMGGTVPAAPAPRLPAAPVLRRTITAGQIRALTDAILAVPRIARTDLWNLWLDLAESYYEHPLPREQIAAPRIMLLRLIHDLSTLAEPAPARALDALVRALEDVQPTGPEIEHVRALLAELTRPADSAEQPS
ncbi:toll/interleukin-1 receptor domain-containing protein [Embleya sp. NBC_00888]|uniref:TIR domain-containing protein n=1 Tax=Embleya sp. NBC_00888 TaxID=2975960 RepID=UPI0038689AC8|nr:toll/interleukin-1 receptor domain-containing protein [Embleya sp. NBC_00888]